MERFHNVQLEIGEGVATLWLDRPERHHAIDRGMMDGLEAALDRLDQQTDCRVLILTATGEESFCAGGDLTYFASLKTETAVRGMCRQMIGLLTRLSNERRVVVAAVNGQALGGGCEMLAYAHLRVASRRARFAFRQAVNGIVTGWGGGVRWFQQLGPANLLPLLLTGQTVDATQARAIGLVHQVVPPEQLLPHCRELAGAVLRCAPAAVRGFLQLNALFQTNLSPEKFLEAEQRLFVQLWQEPTFQNILQHYAGKR